MSDNNNPFENGEDAQTNYSSIQYEEQPRYAQRQPITLQPQALQRDNRINNRNNHDSIEEFQMTDVQTAEYPGPRRPIPVSTLDWQSTNRSQFIPIHGLDFLIGVNSILIQQTVELGDMMSSMETQNRYTVRVPGGETLYVASEMSMALQRFFCGARRSCIISLADHTRQEALLMHRRMAFSSCCFPCRLQEIHVVAPPGEYLGRIHQQWTLSIPFFLIKDENDDLLFVLEGSPMNNFCCKTVEAEFKILSADAMTEQGTINHKWDNQLVNYTMKVTFPVSCADPKKKALIIGAAFLLEYTYFVRAKSNKIFSVCC